MNKEFNYLTCKERYGLIQSTLTSFVEHPSAPIVDIVDGKVNPRQELLDLIDFEALQMNPTAYDKVKAVLTEKVLSKNLDYTADSDEVCEFVKSSIHNYIVWIKNRNEHGIITWDELRKRLHRVDKQNSPYGIRVQKFGRVYYQLYFNYMVDEGEIIKLYNADWDEDCEKSNEGTVVDTATYVAITSGDIIEIRMGSADLVFDCGLRDVTITYNNGEDISLRFSESN